MKIVATYREILHNADWDTFCEMRGYNVWIINEGQVDGNEEVTLTPEEAERINLKMVEPEAFPID